jgi:ribosomal protein L21E
MKKPTTKKGKMAKVSKVMKEFKAGSLHSGKGGKVVKSPKQAIAIALSSSGMSKKKRK